MILFFTILGAAITLFLGFLVYFHSPNSASNKIFFLQTIATATWSIVNYISIIADPSYALTAIRLALFFAVPHVMIFVIFVKNFPDSKFVLPRKSFVSLFALMLILMALTLSPYIFSGLTVNQGAPIPVPGPLMPFFGISIVAAIALTFFEIFKKYSRSEGIEKKQWRDISGGLILSYALIIVLIFIEVVLFKNSSFVRFAGLFILPIVIGSTYAILRHNLLNVKVVTTEIMVFFLLFISIWQILLAKDIWTTILQIAITVLLLLFSVLLIRSILREVRQREQLQKLSKELEQANIQLKQLDQAKSEFLSVASHQLRTPLTAIKGYVSMLLSGDFGKLDPKQEEPIKIIYDSSQRLVELIADLLDLSRIESGTMEFNFAAVDLGPIIESVLEELKQRAQGHNLYLYFDNVHSKCPEIRADKEKIRQVIINLIDNAIKYTTQGGVTLRLHNTGDTLQLEVSDTGIGIDPEDQKKIFQKFFRTDAANEITREGTGLGIYVVKKLVEVQGGKIWFDSKGLGKGTTFYVSFPLPKGKIVEETLKIKSLEAF